MQKPDIIRAFMLHLVAVPSDHEPEGNLTAHPLQKRLQDFCIVRGGHVPAIALAQLYDFTVCISALLPDDTLGYDPTTQPGAHVCIAGRMTSVVTALACDQAQRTLAAGARDGSVQLFWLRGGSAISAARVEPYHSPVTSLAYVKVMNGVLMVAAA